MARPHVILTARDIMARSLITLSPELSIFDAMSTLMTKRISGAPVVDESGLLIGVLSELDCLRLLSSDDFYADEQEGGGCVRDFMTTSHRTIGPHLGLYAIAHYFLTTSVRRLPVVADERLLGQVSRRDVLRGIEKMRRARRRAPADDYLSVARSWSAL
ncbi:MAG: CBS domain-containing protein [Myxococcota bacterium]